MTRHAGDTFPIVALGASAGGLEALETFFRNLTAASGMAYVVIQHLDPDHEHILTELLQRTTSMPVAQVIDGVQVQRNCVYVIPPNRSLSLLNGRLRLVEPATPHGLHLPIDFFFKSLAEARLGQAACVILSGMGADGAQGLRAIHAHGGLVMAQVPASAKFDSMPRSAIDTGLVDGVATAKDLPLRIAEHFATSPPASRKVTTREHAPAVDDDTNASAFKQICAQLRERTQHDFSRYKKESAYRRIERRMAIHHLPGFADYAQFLRHNPQEVDLLSKEMLIGITSFFRDPATWACLQEKVIPELLAALPLGATSRAWVAGCSTGEEPYSLAIVLSEAQEHLPPGQRRSIKIFATDIDHDAITKARRGEYPAGIAKDVSAQRLERFFVAEAGGYRVNQELRDMVVFAPQDLITDPPFTHLDILTCRNLLIYFGDELQRKLLPLFHYCLEPAGVLMLGNAESIGGFSELFTPIEATMRLFRRSNAPMRSNGFGPPSGRTSAANLMNSANLANSVPEVRHDTQLTGAATLQVMAEHLLVQQFSPAAALVTGAGDILYTTERTGKYLEPAAGKANWNIHAMAREGLRHKLTEALDETLRTGRRVVQRNVPVDTAPSSPVVDLSVERIAEPEALRGMVIVVFNDVVSGGQQHEEQHDRHHDSPGSQGLLSAANDELQTLNEELTTSKEEMQSLNEELQTLNVELQRKVDELSTANNDMKHLLNSTDLATVFLDSALKVRRFTSLATQLFKLIPGDVGRPLSDVVTELVYPELLHDAATVMRTQKISDREVVTLDKRWFQVKVMPYHTLDNVIDGVVMTFNDIGAAKHLEAELRSVCDDAKEVA
jgi:chemotaxis methyl-accepting protein methylase/flagellar motility protein MotE (MotC chaperone)